MGRGEVHTGFGGERLLRRPGLSWDYNTKLDVHKWDAGHELDSSGIGQGQVACSDKCGIEPPVSIKFGGNSSVEEDLLPFQQGLCPWN
jgi:hypothetical protein